MKKISDFLFENLLFFGGEIFYIFEYACFRNEMKFSLVLSNNGLGHFELKYSFNENLVQFGLMCRQL